MNLSNSPSRGESPSNLACRSNQFHGQASNGVTNTTPAAIMPPRPSNFGLSTDFPQPPHAPYLNSSATLPPRQPRTTSTPYNGLVHSGLRYAYLNGAAVSENPPPYNEMIHSPVGPRDGCRTFIHGSARPRDAANAFGPYQTGPYFTNPPPLVGHGTPAGMQNPTQSTMYGPGGAFTSVNKKTAPVGASRNPHSIAEAEGERREMQHMRRRSEADKLKQLAQTVENLQQRVGELERACASHCASHLAAARQADGGTQQADTTTEAADASKAQVRRLDQKLATLTVGQAATAPQAPPAPTPATAAAQATAPTPIAAATRAPPPTPAITSADHRRFLDAISRAKPDLPKYKAQRIGDGVVALQQRAAPIPVLQPVRHVEMQPPSRASAALDRLRQQSLKMTCGGGSAQDDDAMPDVDEGPVESAEAEELETEDKAETAKPEDGLKKGSDSAVEAGTKPKTRVSGGKTKYLKDKRGDKSSSSSFDNEEGRAFLAAKGKSMMQSRWADRELDG